MGYGQLVVEDRSCEHGGGTGCNALGKSQICRFCTWTGQHSTPTCPKCACDRLGLNGCGQPPQPSSQMNCDNDFCNSLNNDNDKNNYGQLVVEDRSCEHGGGTGCNALGKSQICRFCTWTGQHSTPTCPKCACDRLGLNGCGQAPQPPQPSSQMSCDNDFCNSLNNDNDKQLRPACRRRSILRAWWWHWLQRPWQEPDLPLLHLDRAALNTYLP